MENTFKVHVYRFYSIFSGVLKSCQVPGAHDRSVL